MNNYLTERIGQTESPGVAGQLEHHVIILGLGAQQPTGWSLKCGLERLGCGYVGVN